MQRRPLAASAGMPSSTAAHSRRFIGLMSGTSLDGVDAVLVSFDDSIESRSNGSVDGSGDDKSPDPRSTLVVSHHVALPFSGALRAELLALNSAGPNEIERSAQAANSLAACYADAVASLLAQSGLVASDVEAVGAHGQTVRHRPGDFDGTGFTVQLANPSLLAERCGIDVIADFRSRDVAAGGQGAPLVPAFHRAIFGRSGKASAVLNLGGIANLTLLDADGSTGGFDCGPANALMDYWSERHLGRAFDADGAWAASGRVHAPLLKAMLSEPFFSMPPPKSTGRDLFNAPWLQSYTSTVSGAAALAPADVQATLAELTVRAATDALRLRLPQARELLVCGGGALNGHLMRRLAAALPGVPVAATDERGLPALQVEAAAFGWLAKAFIDRRPGNVPEVTGARGPRVLGALYPR